MLIKPSIHDSSIIDDSAVEGIRWSFELLIDFKREGEMFRIRGQTPNFQGYDIGWLALFWLVHLKLGKYLIKDIQI